ncbi:MAG: hypothetical protein K2K47_08765 [Duncaniella sp.]|nr:hypothetical protein [Duncaniella sp.]
MKLFKYLSIFAVSTLVLASCSDDNDDFAINTAPGVGVSVESAEMIVNEATGLFEVPLVLTGNPNGYVSVKVKITGTDDPEQDQAISDSHFYVTSTSINIPADTKTASVEIRTHKLETRDPDLYFRVVIESAVGATVEPLNTCTIAIQDQQSSPVYKLAGPWEISMSDYYGAEMTTPRSELVVINGELGSAEFVDFCPALTSGLVLPVMLKPGEDPEKPYNISIVVGSPVLKNVNFTDLGVCDLVITKEDGTDKGLIEGVWNSDYTEISFSESIVLSIYSEGMDTGYLYQILRNIKMRPVDIIL